MSIALRPLSFLPHPEYCRGVYMKRTRIRIGLLAGGIIVIVLAVLSVWWFGSSNRGLLRVSESPPQLVMHTKVIAVAADGSTKVVFQEFKNTQFVGEYYAGDGLGCNLHLILKDGGNFECTWTGCLGVYGTTSGEWHVEAAGLKLAAGKADGMFENRPLDDLFIISFGEHYLLLEKDFRDIFDQYGPSTRYCLYKEEARKFLEDEFWRRLRSKAIK
jgi:hypothetical protein